MSKIYIADEFIDGNTLSKTIVEDLLSIDIFVDNDIGVKKNKML